MKYEEVIRYLKSYQELKYNIEFYRTKMSGLKAISYSQEEKGAILDNLMTEYMAKIEQTEKKMKEIEAFIENNLCGVERYAVWLKYIDNLSNKEISVKLGYSNNYAHQFIRKTIEKLAPRLKVLRKS